MPRSPIRSGRARIVRATGLLLAVCLGACNADTPTSLQSGASPEPAVSPFQATAGCPQGTSAASGALPGSGALYLICIPAQWNGSLVVYAHGYVSPQEPLAIHDDVLGGQTVSQIVTILGFAFATTSYRNNGLIVPQGVHDLQRLVAKFRQLNGPVQGQTYGVGVSEGGLIVTLATERLPQLFDGTLAACGPLGDFNTQLDYLNDFRLLFDLFFPNVIPGSPIDIPESTVAGFLSGTLQSAILAALAADPVGTANLFAAAGIQLDPAATPAEVGGTVLRLLAYNILGTSDAQERLGGQPFDNIDRHYATPLIDALVPRFAADQPALSHLAAMYQTSGRLRVPLVTLHNEHDPIIPFSQEAPYADKVAATSRGPGLLTQLTSQNLFGHCNFTLQEVLSAFQLLIGEVTGATIAAR